MRTQDADRRDVRRILSAALEDTGSVSTHEFERAIELLGSDAKRVRIGAAWAFGLLANEAPGRTVPYVSDIIDLLDDPRLRAEAIRALTYIAQANPGGFERALRTIDNTRAKRCRTVLWGQLASKTVVQIPHTGEGARDERQSMRGPDADGWGWIGGGSGPAQAYTSNAATARRQPPTNRPVDPPTVDFDLNRYTPTEAIFRDEFASSFKVVYRSSDGEVAPGILKRFVLPGGGDAPSTFGRRIRMWQSIDDHNGILPVIDWGIEPDPWVVTAYEHVTGVAELGRSGDIPAAVWTLRTLVGAIRFAHAHGVIHGGLTPGSIVRTSIFTEPEAWRVPRITDWGYLSLFRTRSSPTPIPEWYLAPEHLDPGSFGGVDGTTDIYGFGIVAYEALFGRAPFDAIKHVERTLSVPTTLEQPFPELESFLRRCLAPRKSERFETAETMGATFRTITEGYDG